MTVIELDGIKRDKHRATLRHISDIFDESRGNIPDDVAFTRFDSNNHVILFNTRSPELNGKTLIPFDNNDLLFAPVSVKIGMSSDPQNNASVNLIFNKDNGKKRVWEALTNDKQISLFITLKDVSSIAGFSTMFSDSVRTKYNIGIILVNEKNEILSQVDELETSYDSNNHQFFQFAKLVDDVSKIKMDIRLAGSNSPPFEFKINNISFYSAMNLKSMENMNNLGILNWQLVQNPLMIKELKDEQLLKAEGDGDGAGGDIQKQEPQQQPVPILTVNNNSSGYTDMFGTLLPYRPDDSRQYFDNLDENQFKTISSIKRPFSITEIPKSGHKILTFETDPNTRSIELKFQPFEEENKYNDREVINIDELVAQGYIKKGGFKNYMLTFYVRLDDIIMQDQNLVWSYGGWLKEPKLPDYCRFTNVYIPVNAQEADETKVKIYTEYKLNLFNELNIGTVNPERVLTQPYIPNGKWVGFQFIRKVDNNISRVTVNINQNPLDEEGKLQGEFIRLLTYEDYSTEDHIANTWGGMAEMINIAGAKYISFAGVSLYEIKE